MAGVLLQSGGSRLVSPRVVYGRGRKPVWPTTGASPPAATPDEIIKPLSCGSLIDWGQRPGDL
ncbi:hypothetical protein CN157_17385 [Sinorhizobium meliloti]|nr:hypothetical protein CN195_13215 [Sinorhizobium meliloti]RVK75496.1 hypothetical protein CN157_17385 [Sinorhizobium meliloti]RVL59822.1 hypothetical protein CN141_14205 [Sinorhizobium meliloti]RVQ71506.1 hypothetical protein CN061_23060 [Sinorhizobium meliloti]